MNEEPGAAVKRLKQNLAFNLSEVERLSAKVAMAEAALERSASIVAQLTNTVADQSAEVKRWSKVALTADRDAERLRAKNEVLLRENSVLREANEKGRAEVELLRNRTNALQGQLDDSAAEVERLRAERERLNGTTVGDLLNKIERLRATLRSLWAATDRTRVPALLADQVRNALAEDAPWEDEEDGEANYRLGSALAEEEA